MPAFPDDAAHLTTEAQNPDSVRLDTLSSLEFVQLMNREDNKIIPAIATQCQAIACAIDLIAEQLRTGGRLIYIGAGTSGRLGVLDASECPPTFRTPPEMVVGLIAGGPAALTRAIEGAEDNPEQGMLDLQAIQFSNNDVLVGIASSGRTPYVLGAVKYARFLGANTVGISCNADSALSQVVEVSIAPVVGPEVLSGSTRLKAGTATKLVLNMLTTGTMVKLGKTFGNLMVDLRASNSKLVARARRMLQTLTGMSADDAAKLLEQCNGEVKTALVSHVSKVNPVEARQRLQQALGHVQNAILLQSSAAKQRHQCPDLLLGIDGGGTGTTALLARKEGNTFRILGKGEAGPSNRQSVGDARMGDNLQQAINQAFTAAQLEVGTVGSACLGLAGADRPADREALQQWAERTQLATKVAITNDAELLLAAGSAEGWGLAIIAGTGSIAYGKNATGLTMRAGGWGPLLGDTGSAYAIALEALQTACVEIDLETNLNADAISKENALWPIIQEAWQLKSPAELVQKVYRSGLDRAGIASLAPAIVEAYFAGNSDAAEVVEHQALSLAGDAAIILRKLFRSVSEVPLVLAGGLFTHFAEYGEFVVDELKRCLTTDENTDPIGNITIVREPAEGALRLAQHLS